MSASTVLDRSRRTFIKLELREEAELVDLAPQLVTFGTQVLSLDREFASQLPSVLNASV